MVTAGRSDAAHLEEVAFLDTPDDVAMLAHELRRRLAAIRVVGEAITLLRGQGLDITAMLELLLDELDALHDLTRAVLGNDGDAGVTHTARGADVVAAVRAAARTVAAARGATVHVDVQGAVEVHADATMLRQAIENLIDNAAIHGGPDGVEVGVHPAAGRVEVIVADRGTAQDPSDGHGIGLFLVRRFLEGAGGRLWMAERQGGGMVVGLSLPVRPVIASGQPDPLVTAVNT